MLTDQQVIDLVQRTNPVPDPERVPQPRQDALTLLEVARKERAMRTQAPAELPTAIEPPPRQRWVRPAAAFATALVLMLGAIGVIAVLTGGESEITDEPAVTTTVVETTVTEPSLAPTTAAPTTTTPVPSPQSLAEAFAAGTWTNGGAGFWNRQVEMTSLGLFAVGDSGAADGGVWRSDDDGVSWHRVLETPFVPLDPQPTDIEPDLVRGEIESGVKGFIEHDSAVYTFGFVSTDVHTGQGSTDNFVWRSEDGITWDQIPVDSVADGMIEDPTALGSWLFAHIPHGGGTTVLTSDDGTEWTVLAPEDSGLVGIELNNLIAYNDLLYAVGATYGDDEKRFVLTSTDGQEWTRGYEFASDEYPISSALAFDETLYIGGYTFDPINDTDITPAVWRSLDGITFEHIGMPPGILGTSPDLVETDFGLLGIVSMGPYERNVPWTISFMSLDDEGKFSLIDANAAASLTGVNLWHATYFDGKLLIVGERVDEAGMPWSWVWTPAP